MIKLPNLGAFLFLAHLLKLDKNNQKQKTYETFKITFCIPIHSYFI